MLLTLPELPIGSIPVVSPTPGHPLGGLPKPGNGCDKDVDLTSTIGGVTSVAALDTGICTNSDLDSYVQDGKTYVVIAGGDDAAWTHIDVTDPANPVIAGQFKWKGSGKNTYTPDVKTFQQGSNDYIVLALERRTVLAPAGAVIYQVNDPANPVKQSQITGSDWIDVHNVFVEDDASGNGRYLYITADNTADLRVFDIADPASPIELGTYRRQVRGFGGSGFYDDIYVHDVTVEGGIVHASYWEAGLDIFPASLVKTAGAVIDETHPDVVNIDPSNFASGNPFLVHHAYPSADGSLVGLQDEIEINSGAQVVQLWTTSSPELVDGLIQGTDVPIIPSHNLEIRYDLDFDGDGVADPNRLFVGWYQAGLEAWDFSGTGFSREPISQGRTSVQYHQVQTEANDGAYSGTWGVRLENITVAGVTNLYIFQSDRNYGLIIDCVGCPEPEPAVSVSTTPESQSKEGSPGDTVNYTFQVTNTGDLEDTYALSISSTWGSLVTPTSLSLAAGDSANVTVSHIIPDTAVDGDSNTGTLTASSADTEASDTSTFTTTATVGAAGDTGTVKGKVINASTGKNLGGVLVEIVETGQSATTNNGGKYRIKDVPTGDVTVRASKPGFVTQEKLATVIADQDTVVDFALQPE